MPISAASLSRRHALGRAAALVTTLALPRLTRPAALAPTPACHDHDELTLPAVEGPFFEPHSPQRANLLEPDSTGHHVVLAGVVLSSACRALSGVLIDLWHADEHGHYDMQGSRYRGHVFTDADGQFQFQTILPAIYPGRTRHFHVKLQAANRPVLTTQLFFPGEPLNQSDWIFRDALLLAVQDTAAQMRAQFQFVLEV